jgi:hypothetical protein
MKPIRFFLPALLGIALFVGCSKDSNTNTSETSEFAPIAADRSDCDVTPVLINASTTYRGGNVRCDQIGTYDFSSGAIADDSRCGGSYGPFTWTTEDCKYLTWNWIGSGSTCGLTVIVKGSNASHVYTYAPGCTSGTVNAPINASGGPAAVSSVTFCWNDCGDNVCNEETGWGGSSAGGGNAWWFYFNTQGAWTQPIYAGQQLTDGTITYDGANFTIDLGSWSLNPNTTEPVKAQGYNTLPATRPAAGLFTLYKGTSLTFPGDGSLYYAIHLDLQQCE